MMQLLHFFAVCLFLLTVCSHGSLGRPSRENKIGPKRERNCRVADFEVQTNFQMDMYVGTWYHISQNHQPVRYQRRSHYSLLEDGSGLSMRAARVVGIRALDCTTFEFEALGRPADASTPAKMYLSVPKRPLLREEYWVLYTDYENMAIIYSCNRLTVAGTCRPGAAKLWVIGRTTQLTDTQLEQVQQVTQGVCIDPESLQMIPSDCDTSLGIAPTTTTQVLETDGADKLKGLTQSCIVDQFPVHKTFSANKYLGTWYVAAHVQPSTYPYQRRSVYSLTDDGSIAMATQRISRDGQCHTMPFNAITYLPDGASEGAKLLLNVTGMDMPPDDYWIMYVDYDNYAIVYSCSARSGDGTCEDNAARLWVMSRRMSLSDAERSHVMQVLQDVCIEPSQLEDVPTDCDGVLNLPTGDKKEDVLEEIISTEEIEISCIVDDFQVQDNFVVEKFLGEWFSIKHKNPAIFKQQTSFRSMVFKPSDDKNAAHMEVLIQDIKVGEECGQAENQAGFVWVSDTAPAKFTISFQAAEGQGDDTGGWNFWILATDYVNYAIAYACHVIEENNTCDPNAEELWVLSRTPSRMTISYQYHIENAVNYVCMDPRDLVDNGEPCTTGSTKVKPDKLKKFVPVDPAELTGKRTCDSSLTQYGCCLLEDKPASGPNYEGCPRAPPPVAGQPLPGEPQDITNPGKCDEKIICKLGCLNGFARDAYGCEICMCADEPQADTRAKSAIINAPEVQPAIVNAPEVQQRQLTECEEQRKFMVDYLKETGQTSDYYLPHCDDNGLFHPTQCYAGTSVCWCVEPSDGSVIDC